MKKLKLMNHMGTGGLLVQSECKTELTYQVVECIQFMTRRDTQLIMPPTQYVQVNVYLLERLCGSEPIFYRTSQEK